MEKLIIEGGNPLSGQITIAGAKNAALPLLATCLLTEQPITLSNVPHLDDITTMINLLSEYGVSVNIASPNLEEKNQTQINPKQQNFGKQLKLQAAKINNIHADYDLVRTMRASVLIMGPLLARDGFAAVSMPGGCAIGTRPIDLHLMAFEKMGAKIELEDGYVIAKSPTAGLIGADITFPIISVGATENALMAACLANGTTTLSNAACEPEISDLANCLNKMGAKITGIGSNKLTIIGVKKLNSAEHNIIYDRIEAGSYALAALITGGEITLNGVQPNFFGTESLVDKIQQTGAMIEQNPLNHQVTISSGAKISPISITTAPYPDFPTDMQAQWLSLMCLAQGKSIITENIFENRFMHVAELRRMGAKIKINDNQAIVTGVKKLKPAKVMATDLRASMSLILAALSAKGKSEISRIYHLDRGYEHIEEKLSQIGAKIMRLNESHNTPQNKEMSQNS